MWNSFVPFKKIYLHVYLFALNMEKWMLAYRAIAD